MGSHDDDDGGEGEGGCYLMNTCLHSATSTASEMRFPKACQPSD